MVILRFIYINSIYFFQKQSIVVTIWPLNGDYGLEEAFELHFSERVWWGFNQCLLAPDLTPFASLGAVVG